MRRVGFAIASAFVSSSQCLAQPCTPAWSARFVPRDTTDMVPSSIISLTPFAVGSGASRHNVLIALGTFSSIGGTHAAGIAQWDGQSWSAIQPGFGFGPSYAGEPHLAAVCDTNATGSPLLFVVGTPTGSGTHDVAAWNGTSWTSAASNVISYYLGDSLPEFVGEVGGIFAVDPDGPGPEPASLYAALNEVSYVGASLPSRIYRLANGAWTPVGGSGFGAGPGYASDLVAFDPDGPGPQPTTLFAPMYGGPGAPAALKRLDGNTWTTVTTNIPYGASLAVFARPGGAPGELSLYLAAPLSYPSVSGHIFILVGPQLVPLADADGPIDGLSVIDDDGPGPHAPALFVTGTFSHISGIAASGIARFDGTTWSALGPGIRPDPYFYYNPVAVRALATFDDDRTGPSRTFLYAGGDFTTAGYAPARAIAHWDGLAWLPPGKFVDNSVHALLAADDGSGPALYVGGAFLSSGGLRTVGISRWDGQSFSQLTAGMNHHVDALALFQGQVIAAGKFTLAGNTACSRIARWTGSAWGALGAGLSDTVDAVTTFNDGSGTALFAGGRFTAAGGAPAAHIARWNGQAWSPLGLGVDGEVTALATYAGKLCAGGSFAHAGVFAANRVASWDGATWHPLADGPPSTVAALAAHRGVLYAGGTSATDPSVALVSAWNGQSWFTLPPLAGPVSSTTRLTALYSFDEDGTGPGRPALYASGDFDHSGTTPLPHLARWDGLAWSVPPQGIDAAALAFAPFGGTPTSPMLYAGGEFMSAGGSRSWFLASLTGCPPTCEPNCDGSTTVPILNVLDFTCFLQRFSAGDPYANCDASSAPPILNVADFACYLQRFAAGCP
jgi:hypothetical protein